MTGRLNPRARRIALALAPAIVPPGRLSDGAGEGTILRLESLLSSGGTLRRYDALMYALDVMSRVWRGAAFVRLDRDEAEELLTRWSRAGGVRRRLQAAVTTPIKLAHYGEDAAGTALRDPQLFGRRLVED